MSEAEPADPISHLPMRVCVQVTSDMFEKLAYSYAFAQSVKLTVFEEVIENTIESTRNIPGTNLDTRIHRHRHTDTQTHRQRQTEADRYTDRHRHRHRHTQTDRQTEREHIVLCRPHV